MAPPRVLRAGSAGVRRGAARGARRSAERLLFASVVPHYIPHKANATHVLMVTPTRIIDFMNQGSQLGLGGKTSCR